MSITALGSMTGINCKSFAPVEKPEIPPFSDGGIVAPPTGEIPPFSDGGIVAPPKMPDGHVCWLA